MMFTTAFQLTVSLGPEDWKPQTWDYSWSYMWVKSVFENDGWSTLITHLNPKWRIWLCIYLQPLSGFQQLFNKLVLCLIALLCMQWVIITKWVVISEMIWNIWTYHIIIKGYYLPPCSKKVLKGATKKKVLPMKDVYVIKDEGQYSKKIE